MAPRPDVLLHDAVAMAEIELYGEVLAAAARSRRRFTQAEVDRILGVHGHLPPPPEGTADLAALLPRPRYRHSHRAPC